MHPLSRITRLAPVSVINISAQVTRTVFRPLWRCKTGELARAHLQPHLRKSTCSGPCRGLVHLRFTAARSRCARTDRTDTSGVFHRFISWPRSADTDMELESLITSLARRYGHSPDDTTRVRRRSSQLDEVLPLLQRYTLARLTSATPHEYTLSRLTAEINQRLEGRQFSLGAVRKALIAHRLYSLWKSK